MPRLGVDQVADLLERLESRHLAVTEALCARQRHRRSTCTRCSDVCPTGAIYWDEGLAIDWEDCTGCGICAAVCPTGGLEAQMPTDDELQVQIQRALSQQDWVGFACPRAQERYGGRGRCLTVSCLGRLNESLLVGAVAYGAQSVWLLDGVCEDCPQSVGRTAVGVTVAKSNVLLHAFGVSATVAFRSNLLGDQPAGAGGNGSSQGVSRRGLLRALARETAWVGEAQAEGVESSWSAGVPSARIKGELPRAIPAHRLLLLAALKRLGSPVEPVFTGDVDGLFAQFSLGASCTACQMCAFFCPTGALTKVEDGDRVGLAFRVASCTNCSLCRDICYKDAVVLTYDLDLNQVLDLSVEWLFVQEQEEPPWKKPPDERLGRQILDLLGR